MAAKYVSWSDAETEKLIAIIASLNVMSVLDGKRQRNEKAYCKVAAELGIDGKGLSQCRTKSKKLKQKYKEERTKCSKTF